MKKIKRLNLSSAEKTDIKYEIQNFPDGQKSIIIGIETLSTRKDNTILIETRLTSFVDVEILLCATQALRELGYNSISVHIVYFLGARSDRRFEVGGVNYIKNVIAPIINSQNYEDVSVTHPHSDVLEACLNNFRKVDNNSIVKAALANIDNKNGAPNRTCFVSPDAGAMKTVFGLAQKFNARELIVGTKVRNLKTGEIIKTEISDANYEGIENMVIIDDLCDGGRTFIELSKAIKAKGYSGKIFLIVTHGIFSKGFEELNIHFDKIYTTNSYRNYVETDKLSVFSII